MQETSHGRAELRRCIEECGCQNARLTCEQLIQIMQELVETRTTVAQLKLLFNSINTCADGKIHILEFVDFLYDGHEHNASGAKRCLAAPSATGARPSQGLNVRSTGDYASASTQTEKQSATSAKLCQALNDGSAGDKAHSSMQTEDTDSSAAPTRSNATNIQQDTSMRRSLPSANVLPASSDQQTPSDPPFVGDQQGTATAAAWLMNTLDQERREKHWLAGKYDEVCAEEHALHREIAAVRAQRDQQAVAACLMNSLDQERQEKRWLAGKFDEACDEERALRSEIAAAQAELDKLKT